MRTFVSLIQLGRSAFPLLLLVWLALCTTSVAGEHLSKSVAAQRKGLSFQTIHAVFSALPGVTVQS